MWMIKIIKYTGSLDKTISEVDLYYVKHFYIGANSFIVTVLLQLGIFCACVSILGG